MRMKKWVVLAVFVLSLIALLPVSLHLAEPFFTHRYEPNYEVPVLLVFPERVEVRWVKDIAELVPLTRNPAYTFAIPSDRQQWVEEQLRRAPPPRPGSAWSLRVRQLGDDTQRIELEAYRDGFTGLIYDARKTSITPVAYRRAGPGAAFVYLMFDVLLSCVLTVLVWIAMHFVIRQRSRA